jgi:hypothetical protein
LFGVQGWPVDRRGAGGGGDVVEQLLDSAGVFGQLIDGRLVCGVLAEVGELGQDGVGEGAGEFAAAGLEIIDAVGEVAQVRGEGGEFRSGAGVERA